MVQKRLTAWLGGYRSALASRDLRLLFAGLAISETGTWAYNVALLAFVFDRTHSLGWVGAAGLSRFVPQLLLSAYGGVVAERTERIRLMAGADVDCALCQACLAALDAAGGPGGLGAGRRPRRPRARLRCAHPLDDRRLPSLRRGGHPAGGRRGRPRRGQ